MNIEIQNKNEEDLTPTCGTCLFGPFCSHQASLTNSLQKTFNAKYPLNPLFLMFFANFLSLMVLFIIFVRHIIKNWKYVINRSLIQLPIAIGVLILSGCITIQSFVDFLSISLTSWSQQIRHHQFMCFYIITIFLAINSLSVMLALLVATIKSKLLEFSSTWAIFSLTMFKLILSTSLFLCHRNVSLKMFVEQLTTQSVAIQTYFMVLWKLIIPTSVIAGVLFISTYQTVMEIKHQMKLNRKRNKSNVTTSNSLLVPSSRRLIRSTSESSSMEFFNRESLQLLSKKSLKSGKQNSPKFEIPKFIVLPLLPIYLFSLWLMASWMITESRNYIFSNHLFSNSYIPMSYIFQPFTLREAFILLSQSIMFFINFISLLLGLNFIIYGNNLKHNHNII